MYVQKIEVGDSSSLQIKVTLQLEQCEPCFTVEVPDIPLSKPSLSESIPLQPLANFGPLPPHRSKRHWYQLK